MIGIEEQEVALFPMSGKFLAQNYALIGAGIADKDWFTTEVGRRRNLINVDCARFFPVCVDQFVEEFAALLAGRRDAQHPEILVWLHSPARIDRRKIGGLAVFEIRAIPYLGFLQVDAEPGGTAHSNIPKQVGQWLILRINGLRKFQDVKVEVIAFFKGVDQMQAIAVAVRDGGHNLTPAARQNQDLASVSWLPTKRVDHRLVSLQEFVDIQKVGTQIEHRVVCA